MTIYDNYHGLRWVAVIVPSIGNISGTWSNPPELRSSWTERRWVDGSWKWEIASSKRRRGNGGNGGNARLGDRAPEDSGSGKAKHKYMVLYNIYDYNII